MRGVIEHNPYTSPVPLASDTDTSTDTKTADNTGFFGKDGPSFRDLLDTINPLNHIPIVSSLFEEATGHMPSLAAQLAGGTLFGGPIGFAASLMNAVFEQQTGKGAVTTMVAALTSDTPATTQLADATPATAAPTMQVAMADTASPTAASTTADTQATRNRALLDLYGGSAPSAHRSYQKAQLLPYLKDVNTSQVL